MKIGIYAQYYQQNTAFILSEIIQFLSNNAVDFALEKSFFDILTAHNIQEFQQIEVFDELDATFDVLISIGGDGTILRTATLVKDSGIPILGINAGRLGFLATVQMEDISRFLQLVLTKKYSISPRTLLQLTYESGNEAFESINFAMNEITVSRKDTASMITIETYLNGEYLNAYWADGLIISTPTGSTGYSMSCGGPILLPDVKSLVITPIAPHNLNARPMVIPDETEIKLIVTGKEDQFLVSLDSRIAAFKNEIELTIKKSPYSINLIEFPEETFLKTLRNKLLWGEDKRN